MYIDNDFLFAVRQVANENPEGFTLNLLTMELISSGIVVAYKATQNQFGTGGLLVCIEHALYNHNLVGGWKNPQGQFQFDSVQIFHDLNKAIKWGRKQKQFSIYDLDNHWEIVL